MSGGSDRRLRVGVAGAGFGASVHIPGLLTIPEVRVEAIAARKPELVEKIARKADIPHTLTSIEDLLELGLDAVFLALPPRSNESGAAAFLQRRVPVFAEKPLATSLQSAAALREQTAGLVTAVDYQFAELQTFEALKESISQQVLGRVTSVDISWQVESYAQRNKVWSWKTDADEFGGVMTVLGCHVLYLVEWLFGRVTSVTAQFDDAATRSFAPPGSRPAPDRAEFELRIEELPVRAIVTNSAPDRAEHIWVVTCEKGKLIAENRGADYMGAFSLRIADSPETIAREPVPNGDGRIPPFRRLAARFVDAIREGGRCRPNFADGERVQLLMTRLEEAASSGRTLHVEDDVGRA